MKTASRRRGKTADDSHGFSLSKFFAVLGDSIENEKR